MSQKMLLQLQSMLTTSETTTKVVECWLDVDERPARSATGTLQSWQLHFSQQNWPCAEFAISNRPITWRNIVYLIWHAFLSETYTFTFTLFLK